MITCILSCQPKEDPHNIVEKELVPVNSDSLSNARTLASLSAFTQTEHDVVTEILKDTIIPDTLVDLKTLVARIAKSNRIESSHIGRAGSLSDQWVRSEQLKKIAPTTILISLTNHKNAVVRCYAFQALAYRHHQAMFTILLNHLSDTTKINIQSGCLGMQQRTGDFFIHTVVQDDKDMYTLTTKEHATLDSILLYDDKIILDSRYAILWKMNPIAKYYPRIRYLAHYRKNTAALFALAKYQKQTDKKLIASFFNDPDTQADALYAVREFPDPDFYPYVKKVFEQEWKEKLYDYSKWRICYQVLAQYPNDETMEIFKRTLLVKDEFRYETLCQYLLVAIKKYPNELYKPIETRIKLPDYQLQEVNEEIASEF
ncbi:hypothetical protein QNI16_05870 [Cytophagaceae bacterium YF14B1]|uniref:HEAT repeat domain-containing protein n=1 Tax=Xanthocytophaga flava TaxID=3048013 RepID=A0AAE3QJZ1_9BACT|nr:hypothetical protein [Xanthocytophaga flavus]MDJ1480006.1 hypothetical protein [Xanthocytophaga flavus]